MAKRIWDKIKLISYDPIYVKEFLYKEFYYLWNMSIPGQPSIEKCKKARLKREEAQELAELDVSNIITTQGNDTWYCIS